MPAEMLSQVMTERQFLDYQRFAAKRMLPTRRLELLLAQLTAVLARVHGNNDVTLKDFLFDPEEEQTKESAWEFFDFKPIKKRGDSR